MRRAKLRSNHITAIKEVPCSNKKKVPQLPLVTSSSLFIYKYDKSQKPTYDDNPKQEKE